MRKNILILLVTLLTFCLVSTSALASGIEESIVYSAERNSFTIKGTVSSEKDRIPMKVIIKQNSKTVGISETLAVGVQDGKVLFEFEEVKLDKTLPTGELTISIMAEMVNYKLEKTYPYVGVTEQLDAMKLVNGAKTAAELKTVILNNASSLGVDDSKLKNLSSDEALSYNASLIATGTMLRTYDLPEECTSEENRDANIDKVKKALGEFNEAYLAGIAVGEYFDVDTSAKLKKWFDNYKETYGFLKDSASTPYEDEIKMLVYLNEAIGNSDFQSRKANLKAVKSIDELSVGLKHQALLFGVEKLNNYVVRTIIDDFPSLLTIDKSGWSTLSETQKGKVCENVSGVYYSDFPALSTAIDDEIENIGEPSPSGSGNSGSSSGRGQIGVSLEDAFLSVPPVMKFEDISDVAWAEPSIRYLHSKGIISGKSETMFAPNDFVTRAEFAKMLTKALSLPSRSSEKTFSDVPFDAWYAEFVYIAAAYGYVDGDSFGNFNPTARITRQDAATIIYRAVENPAACERAGFEDYESIAEYARDAVSYMYNKKIINGVGDGRFAPNDNLTRAQAAKIIHLFLTTK